MNNCTRIFGLLGFLSVALGAFAAHGLKGILPPEDLSIFHTGVTYQFTHTLTYGLCALALPESKARTWAMRFFLMGIFIFSGSLYLLVLTNQRWLGAITPIGGLSFLLGWGCLIFGKKAELTPPA